MNIKIYSTPTCPYCHMVKDYLKSKQVEFTALDVSTDRVALDEMVKVSGQMGVPVVVIDSQVIVGFDKNKIDALIKPV